MKKWEERIEQNRGDGKSKAGREEWIQYFYS